MDMFDFIDVGGWFAAIINWLRVHAAFIFDAISTIVTGLLGGFTGMLLAVPPLVLAVVFALIAWLIAQRWVGLFSLVGFLLIIQMGLWRQTMQTLSLVLTSVIFALIIGIPVGIWASKSNTAERIIRPILDFMQTLPAFVYLIPAVLFFRLGAVPGVIATLIFSLPPAVRFTNLGIRQVPTEIREAAVSFGSTPMQILIKAELPVALPTILAGVNQTIMLALSMVVIAGMIGAGGLGNEVLRGITQLRIDLGFESGLAIVILAIYLDRITQALGTMSHKRTQ